MTTPANRRLSVDFRGKLDWSMSFACRPCGSGDAAGSALVEATLRDAQVEGHLSFQTRLSFEAVSRLRDGHLS